MGIGDNLSSSFGYAKDGLVGQWVRWILLLICFIVQIGTIFIVPLFSGYLVRVFAGAEKAPDVNQWKKLFVDGWKMNIIDIVYFIIPILIGLIILGLAEVFGILALIVQGITNPMAYTGIIFGVGFTALIVFLIFAIIFSLFAIIGTVRFARKDKLGEAFAFSEIVAHIKKIGWVKYIIAIIVLEIVIGVIVAILMNIPVIQIVGMIILFIITPLLSIWGARYYSNLYDEGL